MLLPERLALSSMFFSITFLIIISRITKRRTSLKFPTEISPTGLYLGVLPLNAGASGGRESARETRTAYKRKRQRAAVKRRRGTGRKPRLNPPKSKGGIMNTKEIALAVNKTERSVQRWVKKLSDKVSSINDKMSASSPINPADFTLEETIAIIEQGLGKNAAEMYASNARKSTGKLISLPESSLSQKDIEVISTIVSVTVAETIKQLDGRMTNIEQKIEERKALLPAPEMNPRDSINMLVREYASRNGISFSTAYSELYRHFNYTYNCNVNVSAKNRDMPIIDYIESEGMIEKLEAVAIKIFRQRTA